MSLIGANGNLFGLSDQVYGCLDQYGILVGDLLMTMTMIGGLIAWLQRDRIRSWLQRNRFPDLGRTMPETRTWPALVLLISRKQVPEWLITQQKPKVIALVATKQSLSIAEELAALAEKQGTEVIGPTTIDDPDDPAESHDKVSALVIKLQAKNFTHVAIDTTGGKTPMSLGAFMAAEELGCDSIYVSTEFDQKLKKPLMQTARIRCISCNK